MEGGFLNRNTPRVHVFQPVQTARLPETWTLRHISDRSRVSASGYTSKIRVGVKKVGVGLVRIGARLFPVRVLGPPRPTKPKSKRYLTAVALPAGDRLPVSVGASRFPVEGGGPILNRLSRPKLTTAIISRSVLAPAIFIVVGCSRRQSPRSRGPAPTRTELRLVWTKKRLPVRLGSSPADGNSREPAVAPPRTFFIHPTPRPVRHRGTPRQRGGVRRLGGGLGPWEFQGPPAGPAALRHAMRCGKSRGCLSDESQIGGR